MLLPIGDNENMSHKKNNCPNAGFSLIELILYVGIVGMFVTGVVIFAVKAEGIRAKVKVQNDVVNVARLVTDRIATEIRNSSGVASVTPSSLTLTNTDSSRNPTIIAKSGNRITIGFGGAGACPTSAPCFLTPSDLTVSQLVFTNMSTGGSFNIKYSLSVSRINPENRKDWSYSTTMTGSTEIRSK